MKLTTRGFTLVELMIVIAIIGILAAALFPSISGYVLRSRDTARISATRDLGGALMGYFNDYNTYPIPLSDCNLSGSLNNYIGERKDPVLNRDNGCGANGFYGYGYGVVVSFSYYAISAYLENPFGGYWNSTGSTNPFTGTLISTDVDSMKFNLQKSAGPLYVNFQ